MTRRRNPTEEGLPRSARSGQRARDEIHACPMCDRSVVNAAGKRGRRKEYCSDECKELFAAFNVLESYIGKVVRHGISADRWRVIRARLTRLAGTGNIEAQRAAARKGAAMRAARKAGQPLSPPMHVAPADTYAQCPACGGVVKVVQGVVGAHRSGNTRLTCPGSGAQA